MRLPYGLSFLAVLWFTLPLEAQETNAAPGVVEEIRELRKQVEQQNSTLESLTQKVSALSRQLEVGQPASTAATPEQPAPPTPAAPAVAEPPRAEATGGGIKHIVAKGETLTSIAKRYNIPLPDLMKANPLQNDRKLQIGHVLRIPTPNGAAAPEPTDKKENP